MLFNSLVFLIFGLIFFALWPLVRRSRTLRYLSLIAASFIFYGWWDWRFLILIIGNGLIDYFAGLALGRFPRHKKWWLAFSILANLATLFTFKYLDFFIQNVNWVLHFGGSQYSIPITNIILPVGISFYTFQSMSYTIDVFRGEMKPTKNVLHFFAYLALFPQLVAGPIVRASYLLPQLETYTPTTPYERREGLRLIVHGFFKKMFIADNLAVWVNKAFESHETAGGAAFWWVIMVMFALQIYCDFSGYSDIARGLGRWMGYDFPQNFNHPYVAAGFRDFWTRWHISLSTWFRDYVYIPLGGSRGPELTSHMNMWVTMLVSGAWHGAAWTFLIWGGLHSLFLSLERMTNWPRHLAKIPGGKLLAVAITFMLTLVAWVFFRATSLQQALDIVGYMYDFTSPGSLSELLRMDTSVYVLIGIMLLREAYFLFRLDRYPLDRYGWFRRLEPVMLGVLLVVAIIFRGPGQAFVYFQF